MASPLTADWPGSAPPVQHHGQRPPPAAPGQGRPSATSPAPSPQAVEKHLCLKREVKGQGVIGGGVVPHRLLLLIRFSLPWWKSSVDSY